MGGVLIGDNGDNGRPFTLFLDLAILAVVAPTVTRSLRATIILLANALPLVLGHLV